MLDGAIKDNAVVSTPVPIITAPWRFGLGRTGALPYAGGLAYAILYGGTAGRDDAGQAQNRTFLASSASGLPGRGVTLP